ncbi:MAG: TetR/AcrR family transcriptional regulator [Negativicutes bacterium]|nr:TetR/AcrR family transcriptional regulator [Negativicutes bacterium]
MNDIKNLILDKARDRFDRFGYKKTTMDEISADCRISKKTLYEHFQDKENLFNCLFMREGREAQTVIFARTQGIANPLDRLKQLIRAAIDYFSEDNFLTRILKDEDALFSAFITKKYRYKMAEDIISGIAAIISEGKELGLVRDVDEKVVAYAGLKLFESFSYMRTVEFEEEKEEQGYYKEALVDFFINAVAKK